MIDFVEQIAIKTVTDALDQLKNGSMPVVSRYTVSSDGDDIRFTVDILGTSRVYTIPILEIVDPVIVNKGISQICGLFKVNIDSIIFNIRNKELARR